MSDQFNCGIYKITNIVNGKIYIGCTINIKRRFWAHKLDLQKQRHRNEHLQRAWNKYGETNFVFETIFICAKQYLESTEMLFIKSLDSTNKNIGYNIKPGGSSVSGKDHPSFGIPVPEERKQKIRKARSKQVITKGMLDALRLGRLDGKSFKGITGEAHPAYGCKHSKESIEKSSVAKWKTVLQIDPISNKIVNKFDSLKEAALKMGFKTHTNISSCCSGQKKIAGGFIWKLEEIETPRS